MSNLYFREIEKKDYESVKNLICEGFKFNNHIKDKALLDRVLNIYLHSCLGEKTFSSVAVKDEKVVGIILGYDKKAQSKLVLFKHNLIMFLNILKIVLSPSMEKDFMKGFKNLNKAYDELIKERNHLFGGSINLFIVDANCRGLGIGKSLVNNLKTYMKSKAVTDVFLYTDTICNYGFYDNNGFTRVDSRDIEIVNNPLRVFLYSYKIN